MNENDTTLRRRVFTWIRAAGVTRGDDRWAGGVCSGIAAGLGWSPTLVRALMLGSTLLFGFGAALYAFCWLFLPDSRDGRILAEELVAGNWDWHCLGAFVAMAVALIIPGAGWAAFVLAGVATWAICQNGMRRRRGYGFVKRATGPAYAGPAPGMPYAPAPGMQPPAGPMPGGMPGPASPGAPGPAYAAGAGRTAGAGVSPDWPAPSPSTRTVPGAPSPARPPFGPAPAPAYGAAPVFAAQPAPGPMPAGPSPVAPAPMPRKPRTLRRKPAGPTLVLMALGLIMVSGAGVYLYLSNRYGFPDESATTWAQTFMIWMGVVCTALGALLVALGFMGRRSGGLVPVSLLAGFTAVCMMVATGGMSYSLYQAEHNRVGFTGVRLAVGDSSSENENPSGIIQLQGAITGVKDTDVTYAPGSPEKTALDPNINYWVSDSSPETFSRLTRGVYFIGMNQSLSVANIDLSQYGRWHYTGAQVNTYEEGCPAGQINLAVKDASVVVTLPDGCPYTFGSGGAEFYTGATLGGPGSVVLNNMATTYAAGRSNQDSLFSNGYDSANYEWQTNGIDDDSSFQINFASGDNGSVTVRYLSESLLPTYADFAARMVPKGDWSKLGDTTRRHVAVQKGEKSDDGTDGGAVAAPGGVSSGTGDSDGGNSTDGDPNGAITYDGTKEDSHE